MSRPTSCSVSRASRHAAAVPTCTPTAGALRSSKAPESAISSPIAELIKRYPIKSKNVIAHIRKATQGRIALENCHPFVRELWGRYWVFAHKGDLKNFMPLLDGPYRPVGAADSE